MQLFSCICKILFTESTFRAKYGLALVDRLIDLYGSNLVVGYNIGCAFDSTVKGSTLLGDKAHDSQLRFVIPSFHGHAHNRRCQIFWHPLFIYDVGLEDFETCERIFSASNHLASTTRYSTAFHRRQAIEEHFSYWDETKYVNLSK
jgi:Kyakuja-Dileera-Zisupton transposase